MGLVLYVFCALAFVLIMGWAIYVLPVPGELTPWELAGAFIPALILIGGVLALLALLWLLVYGARRVVRLMRQRH